MKVPLPGFLSGSWYLRRLHDVDASVRREAAKALPSFDLRDDLLAIQSVATVSLHDPELIVREAALTVLTSIMHVPVEDTALVALASGAVQQGLAGPAAGGEGERNRQAPRRRDVADVVDKALVRGMENSNAGVQVGMLFNLSGLMNTTPCLSCRWLARMLMRDNASVQCASRGPTCRGLCWTCCRDASCNVRARCGAGRLCRS